MTEADYDFIRALLKARAGIHLSAERRYLAETRLAPVAEKAGLAIEGFVGRLRDGDSVLITAAVEALVTHETSFFRDQAVFDWLRERMIPSLIDVADQPRRIRIWSAAASAGQEPYSIAMSLREMGNRLSGWDVDILASDLSANVLRQARCGRYRQAQIERGLPDAFRDKYFVGAHHGWKVAPDIHGMVRFQQQNLIEDFTDLGPFDIVFCRNVLIYFDLDVRERVLERLSSVLRRNGCLVLGAAEALAGMPSSLARVEGSRVVYRRTI